MAYVRMHSPPARTVKRLNMRWARQRPSTRGAGPVDDHGNGDIYVPPPPATGATAGTPGSFTPAGCETPANLAAMTGITASPATAWTTGQYVQTATAGAPGEATWSGTAWVGGRAP